MVRGQGSIVGLLPYYPSVATLPPNECYHAAQRVLPYYRRSASILPKGDCHGMPGVLGWYVGDIRTLPCRYYLWAFSPRYPHGNLAPAPRRLIPIILWKVFFSHLVYFGLRNRPVPVMSLKVIARFDIIFIQARIFGHFIARM